MREYDVRNPEGINRDPREPYYLFINDLSSIIGISTAFKGGYPPNSRLSLEQQRILREQAQRREAAKNALK